MARPRNQSARRAQLLDATLAAISDRGTRELRIRDVASAAGVSTGTVHYYFDGVDTLLEQVHERATERFYVERRAVVDATDDAREKLTAMIASGLPTSSDDPLVAALYDLGTATWHVPFHSALATELFSRQVALYVGILEVGKAQGHFTFTEPTFDVAQNLVALEDAYGLHIISRNRALPVERAVQLMLGFARTATGCQTLGTTPGQERG